MLERYRIKIMPRAASELVDICSFIERESPQNSVSVARELVTAIDSLEILPHRYKVHEYRKDPTRSVRSIPFHHLSSIIALTIVSI